VVTAAPRRRDVPKLCDHAVMTSSIRQLASRIVYQNPWLRLCEDRVRFANGAEGIYSVVEKADFALVMPYERGGFWLVEQYRYPIRSRRWEFPQGGWPAGGGGTRAQLAASELAEEVGITAGRWDHLGHLHACYGFSNQGYDIFLATELTAGTPNREDTEQDMLHEWFSEADLRLMISDGTLSDSHSVAALALLDLARPRLAPALS
jgi:8-oxo-dGTP pyrophosphatase MutT (NUDIX family)